jgi:uncharacterized protein with PIN domain
MFYNVNMPTAMVRFYAELNDFLPLERRQVWFRVSVDEQVAVKHVIESLGAVHTEVDLILANGHSVDFSYQVQDGDWISVYPVFESLDISPVVRVRPEPLRLTRFVLDIHLGRLAAYLRVLGFDTLYSNCYEDAELAEVSSREGRILLTRDRGLLRRNQVTHGYCVRSSKPRQQVIEVLRRFDLWQSVQPFGRCVTCNGLLAGVDKALVAEQLLPDTRKYFDEFYRCLDCGKVFWRGSHYHRIQKWMESVLAEEPGNHA